MPASKRSAALRGSRVFLESLAVLAAALCWAWAALNWVLARGWTLFYGDALAHLNIARRVLDSRTPGLEQVGTVWLPLPHLLMLPFVSNGHWWSNGMAGAVPSAACFALGCAFLFAAARRAFSSAAAGLAAAALAALNPNLVYLSATPMTEGLLFAELAALLYFTVAYGRAPGMFHALGAAAAALAATLTRYEGWFLLPFVALYLLFAGGRRRWRYALVFSFLAALGPLAWLAHNLYYFSNPLEFYNGPYSAKAIYRRSLDAGMAPYPGDHNWRDALRYFAAAAQSAAGLPLVLLAAAGAAAALLRRAVWPLVLLALPPAFYVLSIYSSGTPIFVPHLWPESYYNTRYGLAALPLLAFASAALASFGPPRLRVLIAAGLALASLAPWAAAPRPEGWITWKESQVNSEARRAWTAGAGAYLKEHYRPGAGIFTSFGDLTGILHHAGIPLKEMLHEGNGLPWHAALARPHLFLWEEWVVAASGSPLSAMMMQLDHPNQRGPRYDLVKRVQVKDSPAVEIYRRRSMGAPPIPRENNEHPLPESPRG